MAATHKATNSKLAPHAFCSLLWQKPSRLCYTAIVGVADGNCARISGFTDRRSALIELQPTHILARAERFKLSNAGFGDQCATPTAPRSYAGKFFSKLDIAAHCYTSELAIACPRKGQATNVLSYQAYCRHGILPSIPCPFSS